MKTARFLPVVLPVALLVSACDAAMFSFAGAATVEECRKAHSNARMNNNITGGGSLGRSLIDETLERCLARVGASAPIDTTASLGMAEQSMPRQSMPAAAGVQTSLAAPVQTYGFCPPEASLLYGGSSYCVRP